MTNIAVSQAAREATSSLQKEAVEGSMSGVIALIILICAGVFTILAEGPPQPKMQSAAAVQFSAERALKHVFAISKLPHPVGSVEHSAVRDYLVSALAQAGLNAEIQKTTAVSQKAGLAASVENIVARLQGSGNGKSVLLVAHYDSVPTSFGASDDGAGVATLLETARALKTLPQPKRDIIFLFTDGEEMGLLGSEGFVAESPQAANVGVVLNFEARGTSGPAILFETSSGNASLIRTVSQAAQHPVANSLSYEIYKRLPNDTDFTVFKKAGYSGLNFAFIEGLVHYHTAEDIYANLAPGSLQQEGDYALDLATQFGNAAQDDSKEKNATYFDVLGLTLIRYSATVATLLAALAAVLLVMAVIQGQRRGWLSAKKILPGVLSAVAVIVATLAGSYIANWLLTATGGASRQIAAGELYNAGLYVAALATFGLAAGSLVFTWGARRIGSRNFAFASMVVWLVLLLLTTITMPGAVYVWLWPLLFMLAAWNIIAAMNIRRGGVLLTVAALAGVILLVPMIHKIFTAFYMGSVLMVSAMLALMITLFADPLMPEKMPRRIMPAGLFVAGAGLLLGAVLFSPRFDRAHPRFDSVFYGEDADSGKAIWASYDDRPDEWTSQFFSAGAHKEPLDKFNAGNSRKFLQAPAQVVPFAAPDAQIVESKTTAEGREVRVRVTSPRHAPILSFFSNTDEVVKASVNGKEVPKGQIAQRLWVLQYCAVPPEGIELALDLKGSSPVHFQIADLSYGLPDAAASGLKPRPENAMPVPARLSNTTIVTKGFEF
jgi:hypothetical protein